MINILVSFVHLLISFYSLSITNVSGETVSLERFKGKKILLVNLSTGSALVSQLSSLQSLQDKYADSLIVIGFPSNSFGTETRSDAEIKQFCQDAGVRFLIAQKQEVKGVNAQPVFQWLSDRIQNGTGNIMIANDFHKVLIDQNGEITGIFAPSIKPMDQLIQDAIITKY